MTNTSSAATVFVVAKTSFTKDLVALALNHERLRIIPLNASQLDCGIFHNLSEACVVFEISSNPNQEISELAAFRSRASSLPVIAVSHQWTVADAVKAVKAGATDVCDLKTQASELEGMIHAAIAKDSPGRNKMPVGIPFEIVEKLDSDEAKVVQLIVAGMTAKEISSSLKVSVRTYHYRKKMIFQKLNVINRSELIEMIRTSNGRITELHCAHSRVEAPSFPAGALVNQDAFNV